MLKDIWYHLHSFLLPLHSFSDILAVSIGCNLAYLLINANRGRKSRTAIFAFIIDYLGKKRKNSLDKHVDTEKKKDLELKYERTVALFRDYNKTHEEEDVVKIAFRIYIRDLQKGLDYIEKKRIIIRDSFSHKNCLKSEFMPCIIFSCVLYSLVLLIFSAFENKTKLFDISFHHTVSVLNCVILTIAVYCIFFAYSSKKIQDKWYRPSLVSCLIILGLFLSLGCFSFHPVDIIYSNLTYLLSILFCWIGILAYLFCGLFYVFLVNSRCKREINEVNEKEKQEEVDSMYNYLQAFNLIESPYKEGVRDPNDFELEECPNN